VTAPSPSWYDLLGVAPGASAEEVRAAWKSGIADLDPSDRRFHLLNQAAEVLLDPGQRAAYDASLAPAAVELRKPADPGLDAPGSDARTDGGPAVGQDAPRPAPSAFVVPAWLLAGLVVAIAIFVGLSVWQANRNDDPEGSRSATSSDLTPSDARDAQVAAEKAAVAILAYDYRDLEGSRDAALPYLTDDYRKKYDQLFEVLQENAPNTKTIVRAELVASAVGLVGEDRIQVLVFVNRPTLNAAQTEPEVYKDQATLTMVEVDGEWLVDDMTTTLPDS
jgi:Mce-associated membrane protein